MADMEGTHGVGSLQLTQNDVLSHGVDLFEPTRLEKSVRKGIEQMVRPPNPTSDGPYEFIIPSQSEQYIQLGTFRLNGVCKITNMDGSNIDSARHPVGIVNLFPASLFNDIEVTLNGTRISSSGSGAHCYKQYIETITSYGGDARKGHLVNSMFDMDDYGRFETPRQNRAFARRLAQVENSRPFDWETPLGADFLIADRYLPPGNSITVKLIRQNNSAFSLLMEEEDPPQQYMIKIISLRLFYRALDLDENVMAYHQKGWATEPYIYPYNRTELRAFNQAVLSSAVKIESLFSGVSPKQIIVGMIDAEAYNGHLNKNPWNFQHFNTNKICLKVGGYSCPNEPYTPDFANNLIAREYNSLFQNAGIKISNEGNCISKRHFAEGCYLQIFDLSPDNCAGFHQHSPVKCDIKLEIDFARPLDNAIMILVYAVFDAEVRIDSTKRVTQP
jgi:hypothetical protein